MEDKDTVGEAIELVDLMTDAQLNKFVDYIRFTMKDRANRRNAKAKAALNVGDRVKIAGNVKPQYMAGQTGVITEILQTRVVMKFDKGPMGKFKSGSVRITPGVLNKIDKE